MKETPSTSKSITARFAPIKIQSYKSFINRNIKKKKKRYHQSRGAVIVKKETKNQRHLMTDIAKNSMNSKENINMKIETKSERKILRREKIKIKSISNIKNIKVNKGMKVIIESIIIEIRNMKIKKRNEKGTNIDINMTETMIGKKEKQKKNVEKKTVPFKIRLVCRIFKE